MPPLISGTSPGVMSEHVRAERAARLQLHLIDRHAERHAASRRTANCAPAPNRSHVAAEPAMLDDPNASNDVVDWPNARRLNSSDCVRGGCASLSSESLGRLSVPPISTLMLIAPRDATCT